MPNVLSDIILALASQGVKSYVVGGFIRDWLLCRRTDDIDIAVDGDAMAVARRVATEIGGTFVLLDAVNGIARVVYIENRQPEGEADGQEWHFDFSTLRGDIATDLARRDFTINAMALELGRFADAGATTRAVNREVSRFPVGDQLCGMLIDPFAGARDSRERIVRKVSDGIFEADAARLLRAARLAAELGFAVEPDTESLIRLHSPAIAGVAGERTREELLRLLTLPGAARHLRYLDELGLLPSLIPEIAETKGVGQPTVHFWDVFEHSLQTVAAIEFLMRESNWEHADEDMLVLVPWNDVIEHHLSTAVSCGSTHRTLLKLGALFHDVAKPATKSMDDTGRARFLGHSREGAATTAAILGRLRFSNREMRVVEGLVSYHLRPFQMANERLPTQRAIYRFFRDAGEIGIDILLLALADYLASRGPLVSKEEWSDHCRLISYILEEHQRQEAEVLPVKLLTGYDIMERFAVPPGPLIGRLLARVREAQAGGELGTRDEALALVERELSGADYGDRSVQGEAQETDNSSDP